MTTTEQNADFYTETTRLIRVALSTAELQAAARKLDSDAFKALPDEVQEDLLVHYAERLNDIRRA